MNTFVFRSDPRPLDITPGIISMEKIRSVRAGRFFNYETRLFSLFPLALAIQSSEFSENCLLYLGIQDDLSVWNSYRSRGVRYQGPKTQRNQLMLRQDGNND